MRKVRVMTHVSYCDTWKREENQACRMKPQPDVDALVTLTH